jgi:hypothetical protein
MAVYDRQAAVNYALKWALRRNPDYPNFSYDRVTNPAGGGDCTNFVSQALHAGGFPMEDTGLFEEKVPCPASHGRPKGMWDVAGDGGHISRWWHWWANSQKASRKWASAAHFGEMLHDGAWAQSVLREDLDLGDIVTINQYGEPISHIIMITGMRSTEDGVELLYSVHTTDRLNYPLALAEQEQRGYVFLYWKVRDFWTSFRQ